MHPHLTAVLARFDEAHAALDATANMVPRDAWLRRADADRWSIAEILEHISLVETAFAGRIGTAIAEARAAGLREERGERVPLPDALAALLVDRTLRREAPEAARPAGRLLPDAAWAAVERSRAEMRSVLLEADGLALSTITYSHRFFGTLTPYQWIELLAAHRARHTAQIREVIEALRSNAGAPA